MDVPSVSRPSPGAITTEPIEASGLPDAAAWPEEEDAALMLRYREGDMAAFEQLYERHKGPLYRYLQRHCRNPQLAADLFQEVWSKLIASRERYEVRAKFTTFLYRIAHNCMVDQFRRAGRQGPQVAQDVSELEQVLPGEPQQQPEQQFSQIQLQRDLRQALSQLPAEQRDVFLLHEETGLSLEEIGEVTGVAMETAKSRLRYAVSKLRTALSRHQPASRGAQP